MAQIIKCAAQFAGDVGEDSLHKALSFDAITDFLNVRDPQPAS